MALLYAAAYLHLGRRAARRHALLAPGLLLHAVMEAPGTGSAGRHPRPGCHPSSASPSIHVRVDSGPSWSPVSIMARALARGRLADRLPVRCGRCARSSPPPGTSPPATCTGASACAAGTTSSPSSAETLDDLFGRLEASFESQRHFVANASHELRTPLAAERTLLQVALADPEPTARRCGPPARKPSSWGISRNGSSRRCSPWPAANAGSTQPEPLDLAAITGR